MIKAIIFDCFGVLASSPWGEFLHSLPHEQIHEARALNYQVDAGQITRDEYFDAIADLTGSPRSKFEHLIASDREKNTRLLSYIKELSSDYKIGMLSNASSHWVKDVFLSKDEMKLFDDILLSVEVHMVKPQPEIFSLAAERLGVELSACVLVDDGSINCDGAVAVGMQAVLYKSFEQCRSELDMMLS